MKTVGLIVFVLALFACNRKVHIYQTRQSQTDRVDSVFENDTVRVAYNFWAENGQVSFGVTNKTTKPLYVDWKKSSYVKDGNRYNYWEDILTTVTASRSAPSIYRYQTVSVGASVSAKPEQISFIPPNATIYRSQYMIKAGTDAPFTNGSQINVKAPVSGRNIQAKERAYQKRSSPINFRNYMTLSTSDKFTQEFYIDNEFYVSSIVEMRFKDFRDGYPDMSRPGQQKSGFQSASDFYLIAAKTFTP